MGDFAKYTALTVLSLFSGACSIGALVVAGLSLVDENWPKATAWGVAHLIARNMWKETEADANKYAAKLNPKATDHA